MLLPFSAPYSVLWAKIAREFGGRYTPGGLFQQEALCIPLPPGQVRLFLDPITLLTTTVLEVDCLVQTGFFLQIEHSSEGSQIACSHLQKLKELLALPAYQQALCSECFVLEVGRRGLRCTTQEEARLIRLIEIVAETLQRLNDLQILES
jgi:hypothetical protein